MLDSPVMVGSVREWKFTVAGTPHSLAIWSPSAKTYDHQPLLDGVKKLAEQAIRAFGKPNSRSLTIAVSSSLLPLL